MTSGFTSNLPYIVLGVLLFYIGHQLRSIAVTLGEVTLKQSITREHEPQRVREQPKAVSATQLPPDLQGNDVEMSRKYHESQLSMRRSVFAGAWEKMPAHVFYNALAPEAHCPGKVRIGGVNDGGKWVCNPWHIPREKCVLYSLGVNGNIFFEEGIQAITENACQMRGVDASAQSSGIAQRYRQLNGELFQYAITPKTVSSNNMSISDFVRQNKHTDIEIFKIDIEGSERECLEGFLEDYAPCQILIETHFNPFITSQLLRNISSHNYHLFSYEINGYGLSYCEYSFIHEKCLDRYGVTRLGRYLS